MFQVSKGDWLGIWGAIAAGALVLAVLGFKSCRGNDPVELVETTRCDVIEVNHVYDDQGRLIFVQLLARQWDGERHRIVAWQVYRSGANTPTWSGECWRAVGIVDSGIWIFEAAAVRPTWTQYDVELYERSQQQPQPWRRVSCH